MALGYVCPNKSPLRLNQGPFSFVNPFVPFILRLKSLSVLSSPAGTANVSVAERRVASVPPQLGRIRYGVFD